MKLRNKNIGWAVAAAVTLGACSNDFLTIPNLEDPDVDRSLSTPDGIEAILRNGFVQVWGATHGTTGALWIQSQALSFENYGSVANFGMNLRGTLPRVGIDNERGNQTAAENFRDFRELSLRGRNVLNAVRALDALTAGGSTLGSAAQDLRGRSFGFFSVGLANGNLALMYDSVGVLAMDLESTDVPELVGYQAAMTTALAQMDSALAIAGQARTATGTGGFPLPADWLRTVGAPTSLDRYISIIRSMKARLRAGVARTPAEQAAVDWAAVAADAAAGIDADLTLDLLASDGWGVPLINQQAVFQGWSSAPYFIIGMADVSGGFAAWLATPPNQRTPFLVQTPDSRFPAGATRAAQTANSPALSEVLPSVYFRNRPAGEDTPGEAYGNTQYDHVRYRHYRQSAQSGPWHWMTKVENDMLRAEALIRLNRAAEAMVLINASRVRNNLPPFTDPTGRAPGGANCVPMTPTGTGNALQCGTLFEAMKYEKRLETMQNGYAQWFIDSRGWGDLPQGTPTMWPVPYNEMDARRKPFYNSLPEWRAPLGTYGY